MKVNYKKVISLVVCICCIFTFSIGANFASAKDSVDSSDIKVVQNDDKICTVMGEYDGDNLYATLNKETNEITMKYVEKQRIFGIVPKANKETVYKVKVENALEGKVSAIVTNTENGQEYKISKNIDKVKAQLPFAVPIIEILGAAVIEALLLAVSAITIAGATYYVASKVASKLREESYEYYFAVISNSTLYFGPGTDYDTAYSEVYQGRDIFTISESLSKSLASAVGQGYRGPEQSKAEGSFPHYHPKYGYYQPYAHVFF